MVAVGDHHIRPAVRGDAGRGQLGRHAAGAHAAARGAFPHGEKLRGDLRNQADKPGLGIFPRVVRVQAVDIGEQDQQIPADEGRHDGAEPVIVAKAVHIGNLRGGYRVVFIDHGDGSQLQQLLKGILGVVSGGVVDHGILGQKYLGRGLVILGKNFLVHHHQPRLPHRGVCLLLGQAVRLSRVSKGLASGRNGSGGHQHHLPPLAPQIADQADQALDFQ